MRLTPPAVQADFMPRAIDVGRFPEDLDLKEKSAITERIVAPGIGH
jgi:hypothetical protein